MSVVSRNHNQPNIHAANIKTQSFPEKVFGIDGILHYIYGFIIGFDAHDVHDAMSSMSLRLTSTQFNECFMKYLHSAPLKGDFYIDTEECPSFKIIATVKWIKEQNIALHGLTLHVNGFDLDHVYQNFIGIDFRNMNEIDYWVWPSTFDHYHGSIDTSRFCSLFKEAESLKHLKIKDEFNQDSRKYVLSFPNLIDVCNTSEMVNGKFNSVEELTLHYRSTEIKSSSLKMLNLIYQFEDIARVNCPSLEKFICVIMHQIPISIGGISSSTIEEKYGRDYRSRKEFFCLNCKGTCDVDADNVRSIAIVPPDFIKSDSFYVSNDCLLIVMFMDALPKRVYKRRIVNIFEGIRLGT